MFADVSVSATDSGWYGSNGTLSGSANNNYFAGYAFGNEYRNFFTFDLTGVTGPFANASLSLPNIGPNIGAPLTFSLFALTTSPGSLGSPGAGIFEDLGDGALYGSIVVPSDATDPVVITLNAAGLAAVNSALGGQFALGGAVATPDSYLFFDNSEQRLPELTLSSVPEPSTGAVVIAGLGFLIAAARRNGK
jgi:hypothetical protein